MKKILFFIFLISSFANAQYTVKGTLSPNIKSDWVILYKIEGARQKFVQNTKIKTDSISIQGKMQEVGKFQFNLPKDTKSGAYRITYRLEGAGFVDFLFNKENVDFTFHPEYPNQTANFTVSKENILYGKYLKEISKAQQTLDSIQVAALQNKNLDLKSRYKSQYALINTIQAKYVAASKNMYVAPFIKASIRNNAPEIFDTPQKYMSNMIATFFNNMDFNNATLLNSSFLVDRITDYIFYINYSDDAETQQQLYKQSVNKVLSKIEKPIFKKDVIEFLIGQFEAAKNVEMIDFLFENHYNKLPETLQNKKFKEEKLALLAAEVGRIAPDFSWKEGNKNLKLSTLNESENYILVFWSTECSHCLREIPQLHKALEQNKKVKVIAFAMERNDFGWKNMKKTLPNFHHVMGLNKWENKVARTYNIMSTPTYFVLDKNKKIIAKPDAIEDVKKYVKRL